jgi:hypothetical protein
VKAIEIRLRHGIYWAMVVVGILPILFAICGTWLNEHLEPMYGRLRTWCYQERYHRDRTGPLRKPA